ncbi:SIMPL domain-containing protein [Evansella sp. AB-P1]|uniref:SIMPL domain-containing protein n=1 Tax=Evansella sp. AB-P1 TaxID=3037653 RepID=UPI00241E0F72|nr:SIMPL domain-containing protein [Evansella sp. AB-P1]MDG5786036.1 SIMPL domain-containing protein [Evansella sp. AB-P1]
MYGSTVGNISSPTINESSYSTNVSKHQFDNELGEVKVFGEGVITVQPNQATIILGVTLEEQSLQRGQQLNSERISHIKQALSDLGIPPNDIQTSDYRIDINYDYIDGKQEFRGFRISHLLTITTNSTNQVGMIVDTAVKAGANTVRNLAFSLTSHSRDELYRQAITAATNNGLEKARVIASSQNLHLHYPPKKIVEWVDHHPIIPFHETVLSQSEVSSTPIQPGTIKVVSKVEMTYAYSLN